VAKGSTKEIRSSLDAMEAIRGSGAIAATARAAYVLWPPADGGRAVCETLGIDFTEGCVAFGLVAKKYGDARRDRSVFVRDERGILRDKTLQYRSASGQDDNETLRGELLRAIGEKWKTGQAFATSHGANGLHARRFELPESFRDKPRPWFDEQAGKLLAGGNIKRLPYRGGARLVPADADCAIPKVAPDDGQVPEEESASELSA